MEMQIKTIMRYHFTPWLRSKTPMTAYAGKDVEQGLHSSIAGGNTNLYNHFVNKYDGFSEN